MLLVDGVVKMRLPLNNAFIGVENGYVPVKISQRRVTYSYSVSDKANENSKHEVITTAGTTIYSGGTALSLIEIDMVDSEIRNWGEFAPYLSLTVMNTKGEQLYIRPILNGTEIVLSAKNSITQEETFVCRYEYTETGEMSSDLSFYINIGRIVYSPSIQSYSSNCTVYAIKGQSGCGDTGIGSITLLIDSSAQSFINKTYTVTKNSKEDNI